MIKIQELTKKFDDYAALNNVCLHVNKGSVYGLVGPNGSGKTTLIKCLCGVYKPDGGQISVAGEKIFNHPSLKQRIAYVPDDLYFPPTYTPKDMAKLYSTLYPQFSWETYRELKDVFKLDENKRVARFSKGMQKQVAFWISMCIMPDVIILDEPIDGLDPVMRKMVWSIILQAVEERQVSVLISSHNLRELEDVCDYVGILHRGEMILEKALNDLKSDTYKLQVAFESELPQGFTDNLTVLNHSFVGRVHLFILRGEGETILKEVNRFSPLLADLIPLTLEEVFIYELGGKGYDFTNILV